MGKSGHRLCLSLALLAVTSTSAFSQVLVDEFLPTGVPTLDEWYLSDMRGDGTASLVALSGVGGDLENNQPLPDGAALLTTGFDNGDKAEVSTFALFGTADTVLNTATLGYSYYKQTVVGGNATAAPSLKLTLFNPGGTGDNFGQLVYEPNWNQPASGSNPPPADAWQGVVITSATGAGDDASGGWWWTGGFEIGSGAGGPPLRSLAEWAAAFSAADAIDFANADVVALSVGVGTFNQGQVGYFDNVSLSVPFGYNEAFDFVPEPSGWLLTLAGLCLLRRRR